MIKNRLTEFGIDKRVLFYILFGIAIFALCFYLKDLWVGLMALIDVVKPVVFGLVFAFVLNVLMRFIEERWFNKIGAKHRLFARVKRPLAMALTFLIVASFLSLFFVIVLPQFIASLSALGQKLPDYAQQFYVWANGIFTFYNLNSFLLTDMAKSVSSLIESLTTALQNAVPNILGFTVNLANGILNVVFGIIFSIYMLAGKEKLLAGLNRFADCFLPERFNKKAREVLEITNETCSHFIEGQCLDALCLGILSFIVLSIMQMPYALVIAVTLAITNMIPVIGPWFGSIPCAVITFVISPLKALILIVTIIILQEVENKLIYPKIVGNRVGLDGIWVLIGVVCGGELFGLIGIILGVPAIAVASRLIHEKMRKKQCGAETTADDINFFPES